MTVLLVVNPASGSFDADVVARAEKELEGLGDVTRFAASSAEAFAGELRAAARPVDLVVVAGGDGSLGLSIDALGARLDDVVFALLPMGTGNDLATTLELADDPVAAAAGLADGRVREIDLCRVSDGKRGRLFVNASVGGFSVDVDRAVKEDTKRTLGRFAFWLGGARAARDISRYRIRVDDRTIDDVIVVGIGNGRTVGGGLELWPQAKPDDGELDVCVISAPDLRAGARAAMKVKQAQHEDLEGVTMIRAASVKIASDPPMEMNIDGDVIGLRTPLTYEVAGKVRIRVPR